MKNRAWKTKLPTGSSLNGLIPTDLHPQALPFIQCSSQLYCCADSPQQGWEKSSLACILTKKGTICENYL